MNCKICGNNIVNGEKECDFCGSPIEVIPNLENEQLKDEEILGNKTEDVHDIKTVSIEQGAFEKINILSRGNSTKRIIILLVGLVFTALVCFAMCMFFFNASSDVILSGNIRFEDYKGTVLMTETDFSKAEVEKNDIEGIYIKLTFTEEGRYKFAEITDEVSKYTNGNNYINIFVNDLLVNSPCVDVKINSNECIIRGFNEVNAAKELVNYMVYGEVTDVNEAISDNTNKNHFLKK